MRFKDVALGAPPPLGSPAGVAAHVRINDGPDNTFRALRIHNATHDMVFAEVTTLADWNFERPSWRELYDMRVDPYQLDNLVPTTPPAVLGALHRDLDRLWRCKGAECP